MKVVAFDVDLDFVLGGVAVFDIVFAFAGDSTITSDLDINFVLPF